MKVKTKEIIIVKPFDNHKIDSVITTSVNYANYLIEKGIAEEVGSKKNKVIKPK